MNQTRKTTAIYLRTSTNQQEGGTATQLAKIKQYMDRQDLVIRDYVIYEDKGQSGAKASRPGLDAMLQCCQAGQHDRVIVYSFSRFARSTMQLIKGLETFKLLDIDFVSITESVDTSSPMGKMIFSIMASLSEFERDLIRERTKAGLERVKSEGKVLGAPQQYDIQAAMKLRFEGHSYQQIADIMGCTKSTATH